MNGPSPRRVEQALFALVVVAVCLSMLRDVLPHLLPAIVVIGLVVIVVRIVFDRTRRW